MSKTWGAESGGLNSDWNSAVEKVDRIVPDAQDLAHCGNLQAMGIALGNPGAPMSATSSVSVSLMLKSVVHDCLPAVFQVKHERNFLPRSANPSTS